MQEQTKQGFLMSFTRFADTLSVAVARLMAVVAIALVFLIVLEVVKRYFFNEPTVWGTELQIFMYGAMCILCIPYATYTQCHARVDIFLKRFPRRVQLLLEIFYIMIFFFPFILVLMYFEAQVAYHSWEIREYSTWGAWQPPLYPIKAIIPIGAGIIFLQAVSEMCKVISRLRGGDES